jgi:hypothetical protein
MAFCDQCEGEVNPLLCYFAIATLKPLERYPAIADADIGFLSPHRRLFGQSAIARCPTFLRLRAPL